MEQIGQKHLFEFHLVNIGVGMETLSLMAAKTMTERKREMQNKFKKIHLLYVRFTKKLKYNTLNTLFVKLKTIVIT